MLFSIGIANAGEDIIDIGLVSLKLFTFNFEILVVAEFNFWDDVSYSFIFKGFTWHVFDNVNIRNDERDILGLFESLWDGATNSDVGSSTGEIVWINVFLCNFGWNFAWTKALDLDFFGKTENRLFFSNLKILLIKGDSNFDLGVG